MASRNKEKLPAKWEEMNKQGRRRDRSSSASSEQGMRQKTDRQRKRSPVSASPDRESGRRSGQRRDKVASESPDQEVMKRHSRREERSTSPGGQDRPENIQQQVRQRPSTSPELPQKRAKKDASPQKVASEVSHVLIAKLGAIYLTTTSEYL